ASGYSKADSRKWKQNKHRPADFNKQRVRIFITQLISYIVRRRQ
ncbi:hypothetical protein BAE44_0021882, partial [Dichanthelium oligosanthes]